MSAPADAATRARALDPEGSFIVQAPAGSGKTELLTRRVLTLLAIVDEPEEVLAITFTRKAASEMRERVVAMLARAARAEAPPDDAHAAEGLALARAVLERDRARGWQLLRNPQRLNLRTIDALATQLAHRLPVISALGAPSGVVEDAWPLYREVASRFLDERLAELDLVLLQLGNRLERARELLAGLLARRDQWKRYVYAADVTDAATRVQLERMLGELVGSRLAALRESVPWWLEAELVPSLAQAARYRLALAESERGAGDATPSPGGTASGTGPSGTGGDGASNGTADPSAAAVDARTDRLASLLGRDGLPGTDPEADLAAWQAMRDLLLTANGAPRRRLDRGGGCPSSKADAETLGTSVETLRAHKRALTVTLERLDEARASDPRAAAFVERLAEVATLPLPRYEEEQWALLAQLLGALPDLLVELQLVFAERRAVDFVEMSERARRALGTDEEPTDLALAMDLSLRHLLVDEFQDTSRTQFALFERLVAEWSPGDGRTFFAVGDPMQSIYRFRDGDVALFEQARVHGIGPLALEPLVLEVSFRAAPPLVEWVNATFASVFPARADADIGAVPYAPSRAHLDGGGSVEVHALVDADGAAEADTVARLARAALDEDPEGDVAILLRTRSHAAPVFDALRRSGVAYRAIDMDPLGERAVVRDLLSLCLALRYPHDRLHWLAVLRSPCAGLTLADLHALMTDSGRTTVIDLLRDGRRLAAMSADGRARAAHLLEVLEPAVRRAPRAPVVPWVEACWLRLGGPAVCRGEVDLDAAERCLARLRQLESDGQLYQRTVLAGAMDALYAAATGEARVQVMTLHKAKGLEFGTVILPALDRVSAGDGAQLLDWFESTLDGAPRLLLAPIEESGLPPDARHGINRLVRRARERCDAEEMRRLLYVACTRARRRLHLVARAARGSDGTVRPPPVRALLHPLWGSLERRFAAAADAAERSSGTGATHAGAGGDAVAPDDRADVARGAADGVSARARAAAARTDTIGDDAERASPLERLPCAWTPPPMDVYERPEVPLASVEGESAPRFAWAGGAARDIGTVVHRRLQRLAERPETRTPAALDALPSLLERELRNLGVPTTLLEAATAQALRAVRNTLDDPRGRWLLGAHAEARSEWALSVAEDGVIASVVIDRTFVDADGTRWIVDFKTGEHEGAEPERFIDGELERYRGQLERYAELVGRLERRPVRVGLYFPMLRGWREWSPGGGPADRSRPGGNDSGGTAGAGGREAPPAPGPSGARGEAEGAGARRGGDEGAGERAADRDGTDAPAVPEAAAPDAGGAHGEPPDRGVRHGGRSGGAEGSEPDGGSGPSRATPARPDVPLGVTLDAFGDPCP